MTKVVNENLDIHLAVTKENGGCNVDCSAHYEVSSEGISQTKGAPVELTSEQQTTMENFALEVIDKVKENEGANGIQEGSMGITVAAVDSRSEDKALADYICDGVNDEVEIQAANDAANGGTVQLTEGNFNIEEDLTLNNCTLIGSGAGGPTVLSGMKLTVSDTKTIILKRSATGSARLKEVFVYCANGFTGDAVEINGNSPGGGIGDVKGLLENVRIFCRSFADTGTPTGRGLWIHCKAATSNVYVATNSFIGITVQGFEYGVVLTAENSGTNVGYVNENSFFALNITHCKNPLILDNAGTNPGDGVNGNKFLPLYIESYNGATNGIHLATGVAANYILLWEWTEVAHYTGSQILCDAGTHQNCIEGHFNAAGVTDNSTDARGNRVFRLTKREASVKVYNSANISINDSTVTVLNFDSEEHDTEEMHSTSSNTSRLTCKAAGRYLIIGAVHFESDGSGRRDIYIREGGDNFVAQLNVEAVDGTPAKISISTILELAVNDYVEFAVYQVSGGALNVLRSANYSPYFMMHKIGY